ncbi:MAG TPA: hypothetical protein VN397_03115 [Candidatus Methylomirabilis sp.]|nr:hypothetical protein [Candidatus Methylomirabilis sp.]
MGNVHDLFRTRAVMTRNAEALLTLAMREIPPADAARAEFEEALRNVLQNPNADLSLTTDELDHAEYFLRIMNGWTDVKRQEALLVSLMRLHADTGWDLLIDERIHRFAAKGPQAYLTYLNVVGVVALAWQVKMHSHFRIILDDAAFRIHYPSATKPRSA